MRLLALVLLLAAPFLWYASPASADERWRGVDEAVVEKVAKEHGREVRPPLMNTDRGDLLPFLFLLAGLAGGFAGGYCWRSLTAHRPPADEKEGR